MRSNKTKRTALTAMLTAAALILSYIEHLLPAIVPLPGVKIGLANVATVFALYTLGLPFAAAVSATRVALSALLFGNPLSLFYSASGALLSLLGMWLLKKCRLFSSVGVSVAGGVLHNTAQIAAASLVMKTVGLTAFYLPVLLFSGTLSGAVIGLGAGVLIKRIKNKI